MIPTPGDTLPGRGTRLIGVLRRAGYEYTRVGGHRVLVAAERPGVYVVDLDELGYIVRHQPADTGPRGGLIVGHASSPARVVGLIADHAAGLA